MKVYVGATFSRYEEARAVMDAVTEMGHEITHDWTRTRAFGDDGHPLPDTAGGYKLAPEDAAAHAHDDIVAVGDADVCVFLGQEASLGWPVEFGVSLVNPGVSRVFVVAPFKWTVFLALPKVHEVEDVGAALEWLDANSRMARAARGDFDGLPRP